VMCVCADVAKCHRQVLAEEAVRRLPGLRVVHLPVPLVIAAPDVRPPCGPVRPGYH